MVNEPANSNLAAATEAPLVLRVVDVSQKQDTSVAAKESEDEQ
jgi:hypothetical protein